jgi:pimeloyl-ACP methyl ester carboxylesterase
MYLPENPSGVVDSRTTTTIIPIHATNTNMKNNQQRVGTNSWSTRKPDTKSFFTNNNQYDINRSRQQVETDRYNLYSTSIDYFDNSIESDRTESNTGSLNIRLKSNTDYLFDIPESLFPEYRQPATTVRIALFLVSALLSFVSTIPVKTLFSTHFWSGILTKSIGLLRSQQRFIDFLVSNVLKKFISFVIKTFALQVLFNTLWQEKYFPPSRISTNELAKQYYLPSNISKYEQVQLYQNKSIFDKSIGVHWIEYENHHNRQKKTTDENNVPSTADIVSFNHGFGASSLSWLPVIPNVTNLFGAQYGIAHDAVGFGFTDRPIQTDNNNDTYLHYYTADYSAKIAVSLIMSRLNKQINESNNNRNPLDTVPDFSQDNKKLDKETYSVILFGHSMGAITTLRTALKLQKVFNEQFVGQNKYLKLQLFLVAPALGFTNIHENMKHVTSVSGPSIGRIVKRVVGPIVASVIKYILRRAVGTPNFWKRGLVFAWGDKTKLSDSDVLRYQWPSIGEGWEDGLINFATAQTTRHTIDKEPKSDNRIGRDEDLLHSVLNLPEVAKVSVILGGKDRVIPSRMIYKFLTNFPSVQITQLDNSGHDPFEEEMKLFIDTVNNLRQS